MFLKNACLTAVPMFIFLLPPSTLVTETDAGAGNKRPFLWRDERHKQWKIATFGMPSSHYLASHSFASVWRPCPKAGHICVFADVGKHARNIRVRAAAEPQKEAAAADEARKAERARSEVLGMRRILDL